MIKIYEALSKTSLRGQRDLSGLASSALSQEIHFVETQPKAARGALSCKDSGLGGTMPVTLWIWAIQCATKVPSRRVAPKIDKGSCLAKVIALNSVTASVSKPSLNTWLTHCLLPASFSLSKVW